MLDKVVYGMDYSKVALIISDRYEEIARAIDSQLDRGVTPDGKYIFTIDETNLKVGDKPEINQPLYMIGHNRGVTLAQTTAASVPSLPAAPSPSSPMATA